MGQEFASLVLWVLSANSRVAVQPQMYMYCHEFSVIYELIYIAFDSFGRIMHDHLLILTHIMLTLHT